MTPDFNIRTVRPDDAPELASIYAPYVQTTDITFEYECPDAAEFRNRIRHTIERYPYFVAVDNESGHLLGYAYASAFKGRSAYDWSAETSIYVRMDTRHSGVGTCLYQVLEDTLARQHICNLCACIAYPNPGSVAFHEKFGYQTVAHFHKAGYKFDHWIDMIWMEKVLCPHRVPPLEFVPFSELAK